MNEAERDHITTGAYEFFSILQIRAALFFIRWHFVIGYYVSFQDMAVVRESRQEASPEPDSNVNQLLSAIASCSSMRQKAMLATRQLAEACTPPRGRFRENGFVVAQKGALAHLLPVADKFGTDPEIIANIARSNYLLDMSVFSDFTRLR